ncbi:MAG: hypothetical protein WD042_03770 [Phycisphaeraceae bacterium]
MSTDQQASTRRFSTARRQPADRASLGYPFAGLRRAVLMTTLWLTMLSPVTAQTPEKYKDPVPHDIITQPYRVCQDLEELTRRIDNLYRKPFDKTIDARGLMQPELVYFKDTQTGHEIVSITRELCSDIAHGDLGRPAWTIDGSKILFMGTRGYRQADGSFRKTDWEGHKYIMNADYSGQRALVVTFEDGSPPVAGMYGKYNTLDRRDPRYAYYADKDKLWRVTLPSDDGPAKAELLCTLATPQVKIIQDMSRDGKLLLQDLNADPDRATGKLPYMPEIHLIDLNKSPGESGFYYHHPFDYGLPDVLDDQGNVVHAASNNYQFHSLTFGNDGKSIGWNYGPMTSIGEPLGWRLDITNGLAGPPTHGKVSGGSGVNPWGQYESHGKMVADTSKGLYFSGKAALPDGEKIGNWGLWLRDYADADTPPRFLMNGPGGHVAGGGSFNPHVWATHMSSAWAKRGIKESDAIIWGCIDGDAKVACYTYSEVRGGVRQDRTTGGTGQLIWSGPDNNDYRPYSSIPRPLLSPDGTKLWFHSSMLMPTEQWVGIYVVVLQRPQPPVNLRLSPAMPTAAWPGSLPGVTLAWDPAPMSHETKTYHIYRKQGDDGTWEELTGLRMERRERDGVTAFTAADTTATRGFIYTYAVTAEEWSTLESDTTSNTLTVALHDSGGPVTSGAAVKDWDKTAPPPVADFEVIKEADEEGQYRLTWSRSAAPDVRYYNLYFSTEGKPEATQKNRVASPLPGMTSYLDWSAPLGAAKVHYAITAVDRQGNESAPAYAAWTRQ